MGKTAIIKKIISEQNMWNILYSPNSRTLKELLVNLICSDESFCKHTKDIGRENILTLKKLFYKIMNKNHNKALNIEK